MASDTIYDQMVWANVSIILILTLPHCLGATNKIKLYTFFIKQSSVGCSRLVIYFDGLKYLTTNLPKAIPMGVGNLQVRAMSAQCPCLNAVCTLCVQEIKAKDYM